MSRAVIIRTDGTKEAIEYTEETASRVLTDAVGGYFERVRVGYAFMWLNEEGKIHGLPINAIATDLFEQFYGDVDIIAGDVILTGLDGPEGETLGLSNEMEDYFLATP